MMATYPVVFNVIRPASFGRRRLAIRLLLVSLVWLLVTTPLVILAHVAFPLLAANLIAGKDGRRFIEEDAARFTAAIRWYLALLSYSALLLDRLPTDDLQGSLVYRVMPTGEPTILSALLRIILSIPSAVVLAFLGIAGAVVWVIAAMSVITSGNYAVSLYDFQVGVMRWHARLLAYHSSLVDEYPPFAFAAGPETITAERPSAAPDG